MAMDVAQKSYQRPPWVQKGISGIQKESVEGYVGEDDGGSFKSMEGNYSKKAHDVNGHSSQICNQGSRFVMLEDHTDTQIDVGGGRAQMKMKKSEAKNRFG